MKPWPDDAVMIVAANAGEERRERMEQAVPQNCRLCGQALMADLRTIRMSEALPSRHDRPVAFFCIACAVQHKFPEELHDLRK